MRVKDIEDKLDNIESDIKEIKSDISLLSKITEIKTVIEELSYPFGLKTFTNKNTIRVTKLDDVKQKMGLDIIVVDKDKQRDDFFEINSSKIKSGIEYLSFAEESSLLIKPELVYYGMIQILAGIIDTFLTIQTNVKPHGLSHRSSWFLDIRPGFFQKLVIFLKIVENNNRFFDLYSCADEVNLAQYLGQTYKIKKNKIDMVKLNENRSLICDSSRNYNDNIFLVDIMNLYIFSSICRYDPGFWLSFLKGSDFMYKIMLDIFRNIYTLLDWFIANVFIPRTRTQSAMDF